MELKETGIAIFAYNRPSHLRRVLIALEDYKIKNVNIFLDGPKNEMDKVCQKEILFMLNTNNKIKSKIYKSKKNKGLAKSITEGLSLMSKKFKNFIVLEDDCIPRKEFFYFIKKCLKKYENRNDIDSICGYQLPELHKKNINITSSIGLNNFISWGWATWSKKWNNYLKQKKKINFKNKNIKSKIISAINNKNVDKKKIWTLDYIIYCYLNNKYFVFPNKSLIKNIGFDGSGVNSKSTFLFNTYYNPSNKIKIDKNLKVDNKKSLFQENVIAKRLHLFY